MTVLITGAGLVGTQVARLEVEAGRTPVLFDIAPRLESIHDVVAADGCVVVRGDILEPFELMRACRDNEIQRIVHTAAYPGLTLGANLAPIAAARLNIMGTMNVLEAARVLALERVVVCSSSALYGSMSGGEDAGREGFEEAHPRPATVYATSKMAAENLALNYRTFGVDAVAVRFCSVFGPWLAGGGGLASVQMETWLRNSIDGVATLLPKGKREWIYSKDAALGASQACWSTGLQDSVFNIGTATLTDTTEIAEILRQLGSNGEIAIDPEGPGLAGLPQTPMSNERAQGQLGFEPLFPMLEALRDYRAWMTSAA
jgi:nucleoside-diphosphate-sugar epimerase